MATTKIDGSRQIKAGSVTDAEISSSAAIALSKLAEAVVQADGGQVFTADQSMGGNKLTNVADPVSATDAANKQYVDAARSGLDVKQSVRAATTAAGTLSSGFANGSAIDGVTLATGDRILIKNQASGAENGIYTVNASGAPTRATDADSSTEATAGMFVFVEEGTVNADTGWVMTNNGAITLGTTALTFAQFSSVGSALGASNFVTRETPSGSVNSSNTTFTLANTPTAGTEQVFLNGILQEPGAGNDYTISGSTITYLTAPLTGDKIRVSYMK